MAAKKQYWKGCRQNIKVIKGLEEDVKKIAYEKDSTELKQNVNSWVIGIW